MTNVKAIEVPMDAKNCTVIESHSYFPSPRLEHSIGGVDLPPGNWQFLFLTRDMTEEDRVGAGFLSVEQFHSWLRSEGLHESKNYAILIDNDKK